MQNRIKGAVPLKQINKSAMDEKINKKHPGNMHFWWKRSPIKSSQLLLNAVLTNKQEDLVNGNSITVVDPFSGFGGLTIAAAKTGYRVVASDINSVATVLTKAVTEIPARFADSVPISPYAENRIYTGAQGLAEDIRCYGKLIRKKLVEKLSTLYPEAISANDQGRRVYAWIWTRTVPCPNPVCNCRMPLSSSYVLSKIKNKEFYVHPEINEGTVSFQVIQGSSVAAGKGNKIGSIGAVFKCPVCGEVTTDEYVKVKGREHQMEIQLMAIGYEGSEGKEYIAPTTEHIKAAETGRPLDIPVGEMPNNTRWFSPPLFGKKNYSDLYSPRQLQFMATLCDLVCECKEIVYQDALMAGMKDDGIPLSSGGSGALAYSEAVSVYLTFVVDKISNYQSEVCTWDNRKGNIRAAFTRQAIPMTWVFAEGNPFSSVTGNYDSMLEDVARSVENLPCRFIGKVLQGDGTTFAFPENSVLFTELPYYDNVGYADLSDYFYIWMRRCLKDVYLDLFEKVVTSKEELTSIPEHYGGNPKAARETYESGIRRLCQNFAGAASSEYPSFLFFEFGWEDEKSMSSNGPEPTKLSAWENMLDALIQAEFQILAVLPVRTEKPNARFETVRVCIVFRKKVEDAAQTTRRGFVSVLKKELPDLLVENITEEVDDADCSIVGMGCGVSLFCRYKRIINADGTTMRINEALRVIWAEVTEYLKHNLTAVEPIIEEDSHAGEL